ncbi:MAG: M3 family oligoendopeptidase [Candidatus Pacebacteria bacterium]|nr:M3 family oligoendopeptidase [Candidatus Paceibacterota bacterium]
MVKLKIKKTTWNLKSLFEGDNDHQIKKRRKIVEKESYKFINKWEKRDDYLKSPKVLKQVLDEYEKWISRFGAMGDEEAYFYLRYYQEQNNSKLKASLGIVENLSKRISNDMQFFMLRIARIPQKKQPKFLNYKGLGNYKHLLEKIFNESQYLLSEKEEKILNLKSGPAYTNWVNMTEGFLSRETRKVLDEDGKRKEKSFSEILSLTSNRKKNIRDEAAKAVNEIFQKNGDIVEAEMNAIMADKQINDELRGFSRPDSSMHIYDDISNKIADNLVDAAIERLDISKRYYQLKAKLLKVKKLQYYERNVEYGKKTKKYTYQEAVGIVFDVFLKIDQDFADIFQKLIENGQIDVYPKKGKSGGGFCSHHLMSQETFILLNFTGELSDVFTLAHEVGHGINNEFMKRKGNALNFGGPLFMAEVSSKLMEAFLFEEILNEKNEELRLATMMMKLNDQISHVFSSATRNKFESEMHYSFREKGYLSKEEIGSLYKKYSIKYMGSSVEQTLGSENWWMHISHLRIFFYNYQYGAGILLAETLKSSFKKDPKFIEQIKKFLSAGSEKSPADIFQQLGINIKVKNFWNQGIDEIEELLIETEKLAKKMGKI